MASPASSSTRSSTTRKPRRPPAPVIAATLLAGARALIGSFGLVYFGLLVSADVNPHVGQPGAVAFTAAGLLLTITILACLPGLWRGRRTAWHILTCCITAGLYFGLYKLLQEGESEAVLFLAADLAVGVLLLLPATRRHIVAGPQ